ncbi:hypothetical protein [Actinacidiphila oryziradicis]|uniref:hypothetical protein n=1 Tax=Actinacidiphila oryziradicis TaxID=2571141 RepID=UPI00268B5753
MFEVRKSIKRFRDDPAWTYRDKAPDYLVTFDRGGYPFSLGPQGNGIRDLLQGSLRGREVSLFHLNAWKRSGGSNQAQVAWKFSVAVLALPRVLPATAFTCAPRAGRHPRLPAQGRHRGPTAPGRLERAGYSRVRQILDARPYALQQIPGIGAQSVNQAIAAAQQIAGAVEENVTVRIDIDATADPRPAVVSGGDEHWAAMQLSALHVCDTAPVSGDRRSSLPA